VKVNRSEAEIPQSGKGERKKTKGKECIMDNKDCLVLRCDVELVQYKLDMGCFGLRCNVELAQYKLEKGCFVLRYAESSQ